jgi:hypothetical protein
MYTLLLLIVWLIVLLVFAAFVGPVVYFLLREVAVSRKAARYWREKWHDTITTEKNALSLLRPTIRPEATQETLLRAAREGEDTKTEELLRSSTR